MCRRYAWDWIQGNRIQIGAVSLVGRFGVLEGPNPSLYRNNTNDQPCPRLLLRRRAGIDVQTFTVAL